MFFTGVTLGISGLFCTFANDEKVFIKMRVTMRAFAADGSVDEARERLEAILADKVLRFNPYRVGNEELVACAERGRWRPFPALTQMVVFHFLDIRTVKTHHVFDAIFYRIGD